MFLMCVGMVVSYVCRRGLFLRVWAWSFYVCMGVFFLCVCGRGLFVAASTDALTARPSMPGVT